jgi:hypothetical protein
LIRITYFFASHFCDGNYNRAHTDPAKALESLGKAAHAAMQEPPGKSIRRPTMCVSFLLFRAFAYLRLQGWISPELRKLKCELLIDCCIRSFAAAAFEAKTGGEMSEEVEGTRSLS